MRKKCNYSFNVALCAVLVVMWIFAAIGNFITNMTVIENNTARENLKLCAEYNAAEVESTFRRYTDSLHLLAEIIEFEDGGVSPESMALLTKIIENKDGYNRICIYTADGRSYSTDNSAAAIPQTKYWNEIKSGQPVVYVHDAASYGEKLVDISVPLAVTQEDGAALCLSISIRLLSEIFNDTFFLEGSYCQIIDTQGYKIAETDSPNQLFGEGNFFESSKLLDFNDGITPSRLKDSFAHQQSGFIEYSYHNQYRYAYYTPVGINNWIMLTAIPKESVDIKTSQNLANAFRMTLQIAAIFSIIAVYIFISQRKAKNKILLDQKYLEALTEYSGKTIYEWEIKANRLRRLTSSVNIFDEAGRETFRFEGNPLLTYVHPDDIAILNHLYDIAKLGGNFNDCRLRIKNKSGEYIWYSITGISVTDSDGSAYKMIAFIENINDRVLREAALSQKAETDSLTGLFNKATTESMIKDILRHSDSKKQSHVLMIVDADNFKEINDQLGHKFGDDVLIELSQKLKSLFRTGDIVGRLGGDEFFIFLKNTDSEKLINSKAKDICRAFRNTYLSNGVAVSISASVGIALYPKNGTDFNNLYQSADTALYISKERGKDTYTIYDGVSSADYQSGRSHIDSENKP